MYYVMNYFEFLEWYHLKEDDRSWDLFVKFREIADVKGDYVALKEFDINGR